MLFWASQRVFGTHESPKIHPLRPTSAPTIEPTQRSEPLATLPKFREAEDITQRSLVEPNENDKSRSASHLSMAGEMSSCQPEDSACLLAVTHG